MAQHAPTAHAHMQAYEAHVRAVEEDLEYFRAKRLEPRLLFLHRRGLVTLYDILRAFARMPSSTSAQPAGAASQDLEQRIRALEDGLDEYVRGIAVASVDVKGSPMVIEDTR